MASDIDIASNALILIGDDPISSFDDPGAGAQAAANLYPVKYRSFLASHPWSFALKLQRLSRLTAEPDPLVNFKYGFQMPTDLIRLWAIKPHSNYTIVGDILYSNQPELLAMYGFKVAESKLPPHFVTGFEYLLASDFAMLVTESESKAKYYAVKHKEQAAMARAIDSQQEPPIPIIDRPFVDVRLGGFG